MVRKKFLITVLIAISAILVFKQVMALKDEALSGKNEATLKIDGMTCESCVGKISKVLAIQGKTEKVNVSLARSSATVIFKPSEISAKELAETVSKAGPQYKATVLKIKDELALLEEASRKKELSATYSIAVNDKKITNEEFNHKLEEVIAGIKKQYNVTSLKENEKSDIINQVAEETINEILVNSVLEKEKIEVSNEETDAEIQNILKTYNLTIDSLKSSLKSQGRGFETFRSEIAKGIRLEKYLNSKVFPAETPERKKGELYSLWLSGLIDSATIEIYNPEILSARESGGGGKGCGGGCCSKT